MLNFISFRNIHILTPEQTYLRTIVLAYGYNSAYYRTCQADFQNFVYIRTLCDIIKVISKGGDNMYMADRLKELRKSRGLTQSELADITGLSFHAINSYESGRRTPNSKAMAILERYFSVSGEYLRGETDQRDIMKWDDPEIMDAVRGWFGGEVDRRALLAELTGRQLENAFRFLEDAFGQGQELVLFVTEVTACPDTSWFVETFGCDAYFRHNSELLFDDTRQRLQEEIAAARAADLKEVSHE